MQAKRPSVACPTLKTPPTVRRAYFGAGVFLGMGLTSVQRFGPKVSLGFVPIASAPRVRVEIDGAWAPYASTTSNTLRGTMVPLFGSLCIAPAALRLCGGPVTTFFLSEHDAMHITCLLYTSDAADERSSVDLGGRRIIKKKKQV